jgi:hypothetical protein
VAGLWSVSNPGCNNPTRAVTEAFAIVNEAKKEIAQANVEKKLRALEKKRFKKAHPDF